MEDKIQRLLKRLSEVEQLLGEPESFVDQKRYKELNQEHAYLSELKDLWLFYKRLNDQITQNKALLITETDPELIEVIKEEIVDLERQSIETQKKIEIILVPPDPRDSRNIIMELRAGTGGEEASLFVADCVRMYQMYANKKSWQVEMLSCTESEKGGFKEYIMSLSGKDVFRLMQYEGGTHRVQRVPETEAQGRVHTSAITIAVLLEPSEDEKIDIDEKDLRIDTYRSSGAGGQHVNRTDSAVRLTHLPTGIVVACQEERSQHKNKEKAMRYLYAKLDEKRREDQQKAISAVRSTQVGSGDRSERIRTYNFSQNRVTDHRIDLTLYKLSQVMEGDLDDITTALVAHFYQQKLST
ncbi:MAG: peptide chain release factor 1 [Chlamydiae bacterium]|nr:peptide chain release factor 1 [Chlamydiota bacterium]